MPNIFWGGTPPVSGNVKNLNYKVGPASDLSMRISLKKEVQKEERGKKTLQIYFYGRRVFSLGSATLKT